MTIDTQVLLDDYRSDPSDEAFAKLYEHFKLDVRKVVLSTIDADLQRRIQITEVVDTALRSGIPVVASGEEIISVRAILATIARRKSMSAVRKELSKKSNIVKNAQDLESVGQSSDNRSGDQPEYNELLQAVSGFITDLPDIVDQMILQLCVVDEWSFKSVQEVLLECGLGDIPISTLTRRVHLLHKKLIVFLTDAGHGFQHN